MAQKSGSFDFKWWIPTVELEEEIPTAFLLRQMSKKDFDIYRHKQQMSAMIPMVVKALKGDADDVTSELKDISEAVRAEDGFDAGLYVRCVKEIRNIYVKGEFVDFIDDPQEIVNFIAGMSDMDTSEELDDVLWRRSTLTEFETANFTPTSGYNVVLRIAGEDQMSEE